MPLRYKKNGASGIHIRGAPFQFKKQIMFTRGHLIFTYQMAGIKLKKPNSEKPCSTYALPSATLQPLRRQRARILGWQMYVSVLPSFLRRGSRWLCAPVGNHPPSLERRGWGWLICLCSAFSAEPTVAGRRVKQFQIRPNLDHQPTFAQPLSTTPGLVGILAFLQGELLLDDNVCFHC